MLCSADPGLKLLKQGWGRAVLSLPVPRALVENLGDDVKLLSSVLSVCPQCLTPFITATTTCLWVPPREVGRPFVPNLPS